MYVYIETERYFGVCDLVGVTHAFETMASFMCSDLSVRTRAPHMYLSDVRVCWAQRRLKKVVHGREE